MKRRGGGRGQIETSEMSELEILRWVEEVRSRGCVLGGGEGRGGRGGRGSI